jgi:hypothetical protein
LSERESGALIIANIRTFEAASQLLDEQIGKEIFDAIDDEIRAWAHAQMWEGTFNYYQKDESWFAPSDWQSQDPDRWKAYYEWTWTEDTDQWPLSGLFAAGKARVGFSFIVDHSTLANVHRREWKSFVTKNLGSYSQLPVSGYRYQDASANWLLEWKLDAKDVADAYRDGVISEALEPVRAALRHVAECHATCVQVVNDATDYFLNATKRTPRDNT